MSYTRSCQPQSREIPAGGFGCRSSGQIVPEVASSMPIASRNFWTMTMFLPDINSCPLCSRLAQRAMARRTAHGVCLLVDAVCICQLSVVRCQLQRRASKAIAECRFSLGATGFLVRKPPKSISNGPLTTDTRRVRPRPGLRPKVSEHWRFLKLPTAYCLPCDQAESASSARPASYQQPARGPTIGWG
jgi:hypothetical protein